MLSQLCRQSEARRRTVQQVCKHEKWRLWSPKRSRVGCRYTRISEVFLPLVSYYNLLFFLLLWFLFIPYFVFLVLSPALYFCLCFYPNSFYFFLVFLVRSLFLRSLCMYLFIVFVLVSIFVFLSFIYLYFASLSSFMVNISSLSLFLFSLLLGDNAKQYKDCRLGHHNYHTGESLGHFCQTSGH